MHARSAIAGSLLALTLAVGCSPAKPAGSTPAEAPTRAVASNDWTAPTREGTATFETQSAKGLPETTEDVSYWLDGDRFRIEYRDSETGELRMTVVSDGGPAYLIDSATDRAVISPASAGSYLLLFTKPEGDLKQVDADIEQDIDIYSIKLDRMDDVDGAETQFFVKDHVYYVRDGDLIKVIRRSAVAPKGKAGELTTVSYTFGKAKVSSSLPDQIFTIPE